MLIMLFKGACVKNKTCYEMLVDGVDLKKAI